jgi:tetratricopeptide (TPR) repeat protein
MVTVARALGAGEADVAALATRAADAPDRLWALLEAAPEGWLLVLDNADQLDARGGWIRSSHRGLVLVTSRQNDPAAWGPRALIHRVDVLSDRDAAQVLLDLAPEAGDQVHAEALARRLGGLPLALHLAGSHINSGISLRSSFAMYQQALDEEDVGSGLLKSSDSGRDDPRTTVMRTWELSLDDLARQGLPHGRAMLELLSCYAPSVPIPVDLLGNERLASLFASLTADGKDEPRPRWKRVEPVLRGLVRLGLVEALSGGPGMVAVHPVIASVNRAQLTLGWRAQDPGHLLVQTVAVDLMVSAFADLDWELPSDWPRFHQLTPHLHALLEATATHIDRERLEALLGSTSQVVAAHHWSGAITAGAELTHAALKYVPRLGLDNPVTLALRGHLAFETGSHGRWAEAEAIYHDVLEAQVRTLGETDPRTLSTRHELARTVANQGHWAQAESAFRQLLSVRRATLGDEHLDSLVTRHEIARAAANQGRWTEAEREYRAVLEAQRRVLGDDHYPTLITRHELIKAIANQGRWLEAETAFRSLLEDERRVLGEDHRSTLATRHAMATTVVAQGRWAEAERALRAVLEARQRILGVRHPYTLDTRHHLARTFAAQGRWVEAQAALRSVLETSQAVLGPDHPATIGFRAALDLVMKRELPE